MRYLARAREALEAQHAREEGLTPEELRKLRARKSEDFWKVSSSPSVIVLLLLDPIRHLAPVFVLLALAVVCAVVPWFLGR